AAAASSPHRQSSPKTSKPQSLNPRRRPHDAHLRSRGGSMSRHPITKWAQRSDRVFLTIELPDAQDVKLNLKPEGHFNFSAKGSDDLRYEFDIELFDAVNVEESKAAIAPRTICYLIKKAKSGWWPRLLKQEGKPPVFLKVDWDKWQDEDDEDAGFNDFGGMDFSKLDIGGADDDDIGDDEDDLLLDLVVALHYHGSPDILLLIWISISLWSSVDLRSCAVLIGVGGGGGFGEDLDFFRFSILMITIGACFIANRYWTGKKIPILACTHIFVMHKFIHHFIE
ncbi:hypothetical protein ACJX0J_038079, partial [Zea mays]